MAENPLEIEISDEIIDVEFDEMWNFVKKRLAAKQNLASSGFYGRFAAFHAEISGLSVEIVIKKHSKNSSKSSHI